MTESITILCSYVTLGTYIPALILHRDLKQHGCQSEIVALEQLFPENKLEELPKLKKAIHANFKFAKTALRMASKNNSSSFDPDKVNALYQRWASGSRKHFVIFTGFWNEIINGYLGNTPNHRDVLVDLIHMDSDISPSWKSYEAVYGNIRLIKLFDAAHQKLSCYIPPATDKTLDITQDEKVLVHGGGWGIGTYREKISELLTQGLALRVVAYEMSDVSHDWRSVDYHLLDPEWKAFNGEQFTFPPIFSIDGDRKNFASGNNAYYPYYNLVRKSRVMISKPGGGTLNDSISSGVPVVFLEPFGDHEFHNAKLWKDLGYGIDYDDWKASNFSDARIETLRRNLNEGRKNLKTIYQYYYEHH